MCRIAIWALSTLIVLNFIFPNNAFANCISKVITGAIKIPISMVSGLVRGAASKGKTYTAKAYRASGGGLKGLAVAPIGLATGVCVGSATGTLKGTATGVYNNVIDPLSPKSLTTMGQFFTYDSTKLLLPLLI